MLTHLSQTLKTDDKKEEKWKGDDDADKCENSFKLFMFIEESFDSIREH